MDIESIRKNYERLPDQRLIYVAEHEAANISPEALEILNNEIKKRGLEHLLAAVNVQLTGISPKDFSDYVKLIRDLPCPYCYKSGPLTGIVVEARFQAIRIGCSPCLIKLLDKTANLTAVGSVLGGIFSIFSAAKKISRNDNMKQLLQNKKSDFIFEEFISNSIGAIESRKKDQEKLIQYIKSINSIE